MTQQGGVQEQQCSSSSADAGALGPGDSYPVAAAMRFLAQDGSVLQGGGAEQQCGSGAADAGAPGPGDLPAAGAGPA